MSGSSWNKAVAEAQESMIAVERLMQVAFEAGYIAAKEKRICDHAYDEWRIKLTLPHRDAK